jgi:hypothetical protein
LFVAYGGYPPFMAIGGPELLIVNRCRTTVATSR